MSKLHLSDGKVYSTRTKVKNGLSMFSDEGNFQQNADGTWSEAIPLPFYGIRKKCSTCWRGFWTEKGYEKHYVNEHTTGMKFKRTPKGMVPTKEQIE